MNTFPLIRTKWSNEHLMAALFIVLVLYLLPRWVENPSTILSFLAVLALGLFIDLTANLLRYKRLVCGVSAAVTAAVLYALTPGVPLFGRLLGVAFALLAGKHIWGGAGKNPINPAITGLLLISILFDTTIIPFASTFLLLPALLLSLPFIKFRPFASISFMAGMALALLFKQELSISNIIAYGVVLWGCLVLTDPVTTTLHPIIGAIICFLGGFIPLEFFSSTAAMAFSVLAVNAVSFLTDKFSEKSYNSFHLSFKNKALIPFSMEKAVVHNMVKRKIDGIENLLDFPKDEILKRIKGNGVFGFGGAAFPTYEKIRTANESQEIKKHLIINSVECDPGLIHDKWLSRKHSKEVYKGIELLCKCITFDTVTIAVKDDSNLHYPKDVKIYKVPDHYPIGAEKLLIDEVLNKQLSEDTFPAKAGILVLNVQTVFSVYEAVYMNQKADSRFLTVTDLREHTSKIVRVSLGAKINDIIEEVYPHSHSIFIGGGLMQAHVFGDEDVVDKTVNFLAVGNFPSYKESPLCSKCGLCIKNCPAGLKVRTIAELVDNGNMEETRELHAERCISCGSCSYVCLAGKNLSSRMKTAKNYVSAS